MCKICLWTKKKKKKRRTTTNKCGAHLSSTTHPIPLALQVCPHVSCVCLYAFMKYIFAHNLDTRCNCSCIFIAHNSCILSATNVCS